MTREVVNEASTFTVVAKFFGLRDVPATPSSVRYRIKDVSNDRIVRDWTPLIPAREIDIEVSAADNRIYNDSSQRFRRWEERVLVIQANFDEDTQYANEIRYLIKNLRGFDS